MTLPERLLWGRLRAGRGDGLTFRRQHPLGPDVLDFYCAEAKLAVEIDGWGHNLGGQPGRDLRRDAWLAEQGLRTMRIPAVDVLKDLEAVVWSIIAMARA